MSLKVILAIVLQLILQTDAIYNGTKADVNQFPYTIMIFAPTSFGAGVLISDRHVLTAAHMLRDVDEENKVSIFGGTNDLRKESDGVFMESTRVHIHENFSMPSAVNDIGIIELPERVKFRDSLRPIKISTKANVELDESDSAVVLSGWGDVAFRQMSSLLRFATMRLIPLRECLKYRELYTEAITNNNICSMRVIGMPCSGDSGGAIVSEKTGKVIGIASFGKDGEGKMQSDCNADAPLVSTRISAYIDWIKDKTGIAVDD